MGALSSQEEVTPPQYSEKLERSERPKWLPEYTKSKEFDYRFKIILVGDSGVGKTSLITRYVDNRFSAQYKSTIGADFQCGTEKMKDIQMQMMLWDLAGPERFRTITATFLRGANSIFYIFDVTNPSTFKNLRDYFADTQQDQLPKFVIGAKVDKRKELLFDSWTIEREILYSRKYPNNSSRLFESDDEIFNKTVWSILPKEIVCHILSFFKTHSFIPKGEQAPKLPSKRDMELFAKEHNSKLFFISNSEPIGIKELFKEISSFYAQEILKYDDIDQLRKFGRRPNYEDRND